MILIILLNSYFFKKNCKSFMFVLILYIENAKKIIAITNNKIYVFPFLFLAKLDYWWGVL